MEPIYMTGNAAVDQLNEIEITGNVIPSAWYQTIRRETGKPYLNAIIILSDIVYWYRAVEIRDEKSGEFLGYRKKFKADILQRSYQQIAEQFGISKRDASNAVVALEKLGVVKRVFRKIKVDRFVIPNVMYLALDVEVLKKLTFPEGKEAKTGGREKEQSEGQRYEDWGGEKGEETVTGEEMEGTEKTEETEGEGDSGLENDWDKGEGTGRGKSLAGMAEAAETTQLAGAENSAKSDRSTGVVPLIESAQSKQFTEPIESKGEVKEVTEAGGREETRERDALSQKDTVWVEDTGYARISGMRIEDTRDDGTRWGVYMPQIGRNSSQNQSDSVPYIRKTNTENTYKNHNTETLFLSSYEGTKEAFKRQIEYDLLKHDLGEAGELDELVEVASEVLTSTAQTIRVNREERGAAEVKERYRCLTMMHIQYVLRCMSDTATKIRNIRAVMVTALYNASSTISTYYGNLYRCHTVGIA